MSSPQEQRAAVLRKQLVVFHNLPRFLSERHAYQALVEEFTPRHKAMCGEEMSNHQARAYFSNWSRDCNLTRAEAQHVALQHPDELRIAWTLTLPSYRSFQDILCEVVPAAARGPYNDVSLRMREKPRKKRVKLAVALLRRALADFEPGSDDEDSSCAAEEPQRRGPNLSKSKFRSKSTSAVTSATLTDDDDDDDDDDNDGSLALCSRATPAGQAAPAVACNSAQHGWGVCSVVNVTGAVPQQLNLEAVTAPETLDGFNKHSDPWESQFLTQTQSLQHLRRLFGPKGMDDTSLQMLLQQAAGDVKAAAVLATEFLSDARGPAPGSGGGGDDDQGAEAWLMQPLPTDLLHRLNETEKHLQTQLACGKPLPKEKQRFAKKLMALDAANGEAQDGRARSVG